MIKKKLPKRFKAKWVKALRSGDFVQAHGTLLEAEPFQVAKPECCCIGVAAIVCGISEGDIEERSLLSEDEYSYMKLADIKEKVPLLLIGNAASDSEDFNPLVKKLTLFNDGGHINGGKWKEKKSFKWIASYIERYL